MIDVSLALQDAVVAALRTDESVSALVGPRVYDRVPSGAVRPYISIGPSQATQDDATCIEGMEVFQQVDVWSSQPGYAECKTIAAAVKTALHRLEIEKSGVTFEIEHRFTNTFRDADGLTSHSVLSFRALIDQ
jgi:hypothetical protein